MRGARLRAARWICFFIASVRTKFRSSVDVDELMTSESPAFELEWSRAGNAVRRSLASKVAKARGRSSSVPQTIFT